MELRGVSKVYPGVSPVTALETTSLRISRGEKVAIVGPSGSGKSTLLSLMGTLDDPTSGEVLIDGHSTAHLRDWQKTVLRGDQIGFIFQQFHLLSHLSATENVATGLLYSGIPHRERLRRSYEALGRVGLADRASHKPGQLSGGEQQRVAIARALVRKPAVLFADEPTGALDSKTSAEILELLLGSASDGSALVVVTHAQDIADQFARQLQVLDGAVTEGESQ